MIRAPQARRWPEARAVWLQKRGGLGKRRLSAGGARRPRREPAVNAARVEAVVAVRQHAHRLPARELGEADGALRPR